MRKTPVYLIALVILLTLGCAQRPVLYPNDHYAEVGAEASKQDVEQCIALAESQNLETNQAFEAGKNTLGGAAAGGATGAVAGVISGRSGFGAMVGAATGAVGGFFNWLFSAPEPHPVYVRYVDLCLSERGYQTIGWK